MEKDTSKKDILQLEKRLVDIELAVTELKESAKSTNLSMIPELQQKIEDVEDLIMVEQAGIIELKKMMEESKPEKPAIPENFEERMKSIESSIPNFVEKAELESKVEDIQKSLPPQAAEPTSVEMEGLYNRLAQLENNLPALKSQIDNFSKELYEKVKELSMKATEVKPGIDFDLLSSKIEAEGKNIDELFKKKLELDLKIGGAIKKIDILESKIRESPSEKILDEIRSNREEIISTNAKFDSLERVSRELMGDIQNVQNSVKKFETLEKVSLISKDIEEKIDRFKFIEEETRRVSSRVESIYDSIDKRLDKIKSLEKKVPELTEIVSKLREGMDKTKAEMSKDVNKKLEKIRAIEERVPELTDTVSKLREEMDKNKAEILDKTKKEMSEKIASMGSIEPIVRKIDSLADEYRNFAEDVSKRIILMENTKPALEKRIDKLTKDFPVIEKEIEPFIKRTDSLEKKMKEIKLDDVNRILTDVTTKIAVIESKINSIDKDYENKIGEFGSRIQEKLAGFRQPSFLDEQLKDMVNRMIFLESRLMAIESMMQETSRAVPIIIE